MLKHVLRYSLIVFAMLFASQAYCAGDSNNELIKVDIDQTSEGSVKVNPYTDKPYKEQIIVNKKPDNKYVILLPETTNSTTIKPDISGISSLKDVEVKTQQYSSLPGKGYTKITIDSKTPIDVVPQAFVTKKATSQKKTNNKPYVSAQQVQMAVPQRVLNQQRPVTNSDFVPSYERQRQANQLQNSNIVQSYTNSNIQSEVSERRYVQPQPQQAALQQTAPINNNIAVSQPQASEQNSADGNLNQDKSNESSSAADKNNQAVDDAQTGQVEDDINEDELAFFKKIIKFKQKVVRKIKKILSIRISLSSFMTVLQLILLVVLVKIIGDLVKKLQNQEEQPKTLTRRLIHDNNETFEQAYPSYSNMDVYNANRDTFEEDGKEGFNIAPLSAPESFLKQKTQKGNIFSNSLGNYRQPKPYSVQSDFYKPLNEISEEEKMSIFDENSNDIEKTIFKNPLTQISKQDEETLFDEVEPSEENTPFSSDNSNVEDEEFFNYVNNAENDENFFIFEDEDDTQDYTQENSEIYEDDDEDEYEYVDEDEDYEEDDDDEYESEVEYSDDIEEQNENLTEKTGAEQEINPFEHLSVQSKFVIDSNRGFAQVSVDGINALIGYVGSKITVLRKFKEEIKGTMQVRMNEQPNPDTMIYIVKIGSYKTLVEVKPDSIRQLLDL